MANHIQIITYDKQSLIVDKDIGIKSEFIKHMLDDYDSTAMPDINLLNVDCNYDVITKIFDLLKNNKYKEDIEALPIKLVKRIAKACDFLDIKELLEECCNRIALLVKSCKNADELKERLEIERKFTDKEKEKLSEFFEIIN